MDHTPKLTVLRIPTRVLLIATCLATIFNLTAQENRAESLSRVHNENGGYTVMVSSSWVLTETVGKGSYLAVFREEGGEPDLNSYSLEIRRIINWNEELGLKAKRAKQATIEYANLVANRLAASAEGDKTVFVINAGKEYYGMDLYYFHIVAPVDGQDCTAMRLLAGITRRDWFHALWKIPCGELEQHYPDVTRMRGSLRVETKWKAKSR